MVLKKLDFRINFFFFLIYFTIYTMVQFRVIPRNTALFVTMDSRRIRLQFLPHGRLQQSVASQPRICYDSVNQVLPFLLFLLHFSFFNALLHLFPERYPGLPLFQVFQSPPLGRCAYALLQMFLCLFHSAVTSSAFHVALGS